jgi:uncharacterized protein YbbK (DUF523 family)
MTKQDRSNQISFQTDHSMKNPDKSKPLVGISACLLGKHVRYNGGHKLDPYLRDGLGKSVTYVPVCPETECGLGVPREAIQLEEIQGSVRLMTCDTRLDITPKMQSWTEIRLDELSRLPLCGFVFKSKSPSCGLYRVEVFLPDGTMRNDGTGLFAVGLLKRFPQIPVEEEHRLHDDSIRKDFIKNIFKLHEIYQSNLQSKSI